MPAAVPSGSTELEAQYPRSNPTHCNSSFSICIRQIDSLYFFIIFFLSCKGHVLQTQAGSSTASAPSSPAAHPAALHSPPRRPGSLTAATAPSPAARHGRLPSNYPGASK